LGLPENVDDLMTENVDDLMTEIYDEMKPIRMTLADHRGEEMKGSSRRMTLTKGMNFGG